MGKSSRAKSYGRQPRAASCTESAAVPVARISSALGLESEYNPYAIFVRTPLLGDFFMKLEHATHQGIQDTRNRLPSYSLLDAISSRRSRRFARGMKLNGGPLAYDSREAPSR